jgi:hypothetical protein
MILETQTNHEQGERMSFVERQEPHPSSESEKVNEPFGEQL